MLEIENPLDVSLTTELLKERLLSKKIEEEAFSVVDIAFNSECINNH